MAMVDELLVRLKTEFDTKGIKITEQELKKMVTASKEAEAGITKLESKVSRASLAFEKKQMAVKNSVDAVMSSNLAFTGLGKTLGGVTGQLFNVTNQIEQFEFTARKAGKDINLFGSSVGDATGAVGKLGVAGLIAGAAMAGWKIGRLIGEVTGLDKVLTNLFATMAYGNGLTKETGDALNKQNEALKASLWAKYGIEVDTAGMSVLKANDAILKAASSANQLNTALKNAVADLEKVAAEVANKVAESQMTTNELLLRREQEFQNAAKALRDAKNKEEIAAAEATMKKIIQDRGALTIQLLNDEKSAGEAATKAAQAEAKKKAEAIKKEYERMGEAFKKVDDEAYANFKLNWDKRDRDIAEFGAGFSKFGQTAREAGKPLTEFLKSVEDAQFQDYINELQEAAAANRAFADAIRDSGYELKGQKITLENFVNSVSQIAASFGELADITGNQDIANIGAAFDGAGQAAFGFGQIMSGDVLGGIQSVIGGVGKLFKAFKDLFAKDWGKEAREMAQDIGFAISDELAKAIGELAKSTPGGTDTAMELMLRNIIDEIGITESTIGSLLTRARDLFSFLQRGQLTTSQVGQILNDTFADLAAGAEKFGSAYQAQLIEIIQLSKQFGIEVQAITDYVNAQFESVAESVNGLAGQLDDLIAKLSRDLGDTWLPDERELNVLSHRFNEVANSVVAAFNAMVEQGVPLNEIFAQLGPSLESLQEAAERFGLTGSEAFQKLIEQFGILEKLAPKIARLEFFTNLNTALANVGELSEKEFKKLENVTKNTYKQMVKGGMDSDAALKAISPTLAEIIREHELLGIPIDKNTQKLIDQAKELGYLDDETSTDKLITAFTTLGEKMDKFTNALAEALGLTLDLADAAGDVEYGDGPTMPPGMGGGRHESNPSRQHIRVPHIVTHAGPVVLHPGESVHPGSYKDVPSPSLAATGSVSVNFNGGVQTMFFKSKEEFRDFIVDSVKRARNAGSFRNNG